MVERVEVVVDGLDLRALGDVEAQADENVLDLPPGLRDQVQMTDLRRRVGGQRNVDPVFLQTSVELVGGERRAPGLDRRLECLTRLVGRLAGGRALLGRQLGDAPQKVGQLRLAAEIPDPDLLERLGGGRRVDRGFRLLLDLGDALAHGGPALAG